MTLRKVTENLVKRILKINMNVIKCENHNASTRPMIFLNFGIFWKNKNFEKNRKIFEFLERYMKRILWDEEALYESSVRKLG